MVHGAAVAQPEELPRQHEAAVFIFPAHVFALDCFWVFFRDAAMTAPHPSAHAAGADRAEHRVITAAGLSDVGSVRAHNEDCYVIAELQGMTTETKGSGQVLEVHDAPVLLMVADGVGGAASGEIASLMATDIVLTELRGQLSRSSGSYTSAVGPGLRGALQAANAAIQEHARNNPRHRGMATTATVAVMHDQTISLAQIGDSRAYLVRRGVARQLTRDQSLIQRLIDVGELTEDEAAASDRRNIILQAVGSEAVLAPALSSETLTDGDVVILCSDGLSNLVTPDDLAEAAAAPSDLTALCSKLVDCANARGGEDNITVVAARYTGPVSDRVEGGGAGPHRGAAPARFWKVAMLAALALAAIALAMQALR